ncbi:hypothetical protein BDK51DRAFT_33598 [Blyttiomyces helicus]|uniref:Uncharacterized protein n=1 Tax=Blyttiomyces helicus TaxID=388810 RepID=A0A4P9VZW7_9FUNG|nr:hypothetical protein BDK51DRAFT_33598 [Blyttiomyces helicus]|eukprot:RKO84353.1 hypothetical protein BDK51DRAFT_33598 [Blyttiomyces helicus]
MRSLLPTPLTPADTTQAVDFFTTHFLATFAQAREMEFSAELDTFERVMRSAEGAAEEVRRWLAGEGARPGTERAIVLVWAGPAVRKSRGPPPGPKRLRGFLTFEWDVAAGVVAAGYGQVSPASRALIASVVAIGLEGLRALRPQAAPMQHFVVFERRRLAGMPFVSASLVSQMVGWRGTGFARLDKYCARANPPVDPAGFAPRVLLTPEVDARFETFATSYQVLMDWAKINQK